MTAVEQPTDPVRAFIHALPASIRHRLNRTQRLVALVHAATGRGWTTQQLVTEASRDQAGVINTGALVMHRLERCAETPPAGRTIATLPLCGHCDRGLIYHEPDDPLQPVSATKCPCRTPPEATA